MLAILAPLLLCAQAGRVDLQVLHRIETEAFQNSAVMETMHNLTDHFGPRLRNSPQFRAAGDWAVKQLLEWGLSDGHLQEWGPFSNGWEYMAQSGGEEQGLLGSAAYVKQHFADPEVMQPTAKHGGFSGYFNVDNGGGRISGVRPVFEAWFAALKDLTPGVITIRETTGTDHLSFDRVGLPGFQLVQDPMDYDTRTHHSNMDVDDRVQVQDLERGAVVEALFVYNAATRPDMLPRKDLPQPLTTAGTEGRGC